MGQTQTHYQRRPPGHPRSAIGPGLQLELIVFHYEVTAYILRTYCTHFPCFRIQFQRHDTNTVMTFGV